MKKFKNLLNHSFCILFIVFLFMNAAQANILVNGDFETGLTGWTWTPDYGSEDSMVATVEAFSSSNAFRVNPGNDDGGTFAEALGGTLSQNVSIVTGVTYSIGGLLAIQEVAGVWNGGSGTIGVYLDNSLLYSFNPGSVEASEIIEREFSVSYISSTTGIVPLDLTFTRSFTNEIPSIYHWADHLYITGDPVPEPATMMFFGLGLLGLAGVSRRNK